jgi:hypothetical protein
MSPAPNPRDNHILGALPALERERLYPHMKLVPMPLGMVLYESGAALRHIYFPTNSIVSEVRRRRAAPSCKAPAMRTALREIG